MLAKYNRFGSLCSVFVIFIVAESKNDCLTKFCGNKSLPVHYPFQLEGNKHQEGCDKNRAVTLQCNNQDNNVPVLNLVNSGDFFVRSIVYSSQTIQLYDPSNCLVSRIISPSFSVSPLIAINYLNYTFYSCPLSLNVTRSNFTAISCLSNSTFSVFATSSILRAQELSNSGCNMFQTVPIPVSSPLQFEYNGLNADLALTWNVPTCEACVPTVEKKHWPSPGRTAMIIILTITSPLLAPLAVYILAILFLNLVRGIVYWISWTKTKLKALATRVRECLFPGSRDVVSQHQVSLPAATARPNNSTINDSTLRTVVIGESRRLPGPNSPDCAICMEEYNPGDTVKCKTRCEHYFHERCIDQWLGAHNSCPICRSTA